MAGGSLQVWLDPGAESCHRNFLSRLFWAPYSWSVVPAAQGVLPPSIVISA